MVPTSLLSCHYEPSRITFSHPLTGTRCSSCWGDTWCSSGESIRRASVAPMWEHPLVDSWYTPPGLSPIFVLFATASTSSVFSNVSCWTTWSKTMWVSAAWRQWAEVSGDSRKKVTHSRWNSSSCAPYRRFESLLKHFVLNTWITLLLWERCTSCSCTAW